MQAGDDLCCKICCEDFDEEAHSARLLGCLHSVCLACAETMSAEQDGVLTCPWCRTQIDVEGHPDNLPVNQLVLRRLRDAAPPPPPPGDAGRASEDQDRDAQGCLNITFEDYDFYGQDYYDDDLPGNPAESPPATDQGSPEDDLALPPCPLCNQEFDATRRPWALQCPHVLCEPCLSVLHGSCGGSGTSISCPVCATHTEVDRDWNTCLTLRLPHRQRRRDLTRVSFPGALYRAPVTAPVSPPVLVATPVVVNARPAESAPEGGRCARWLSRLRSCFYRLLPRKL